MKVLPAVLIAAALAAGLLVPAEPAAQGFMSQFKDSLDSSFDMSGWLSNAYGFMPVVGIITEPAIGPGANLGLVFVNRDRADVGQVMEHPPAVAGVFGLYTANDTWGVGGGYMDFWKNDTIRYRGGLGYVSVNLKYYRCRVYAF